jgi:hypothetical protein
MDTYNNENIEHSCLLIQREWRRLIDDICRLRELKLIDEKESKKLITKLVAFDHMVIENQNLIIKELEPVKTHKPKHAHI